MGAAMTWDAPLPPLHLVDMDRFEEGLTQLKIRERKAHTKKAHVLLQKFKVPLNFLRPLLNHDK
jgi:hypothetical protein